METKNIYLKSVPNSWDGSLAYYEVVKDGRAVWRCTGKEG